MIVDENEGNYWMNSQSILENHYKNANELDGLSENSIWFVVKSLKSNKENKVQKKKKVFLIIEHNSCKAVQIY